MRMFLGTYEPKLDEKGRVILPAKFREELSSGVVLTRGQERCIYVFSAREFESMHEKIRQAPVTSKQARDYHARLPLRGAVRGDPRQAASGHDPRQRSATTRGSTATSRSSAPAAGSRSGTRRPGRPTSPSRRPPSRTRRRR